MIGLVFDVKAPGSTWELHLKLANSSLGEGSGISGVAVGNIGQWAEA